MISEYHSTSGRIAKITGGMLYGDPGTDIANIVTDSRESGKGSVFIPFIGERYDAHQFIGQLASEDRMAAYMTMQREYIEYSEKCGICAILCEDTLKAYGRLASDHRRQMKAKVIGITGTNGKTTTKEMLWTILKEKHETLKNEKNYNNEIGVPYSLLGLGKEHEYAVIEMGMNHKGELDLLSVMAEPDMALITNIGEGHLEFLESVENVAYAKSEIMHGMKKGSVIILNADTEYFALLKNKADKCGLKTITFGIDNFADFSATGCRLSYDSIAFRCLDALIKIPVYGYHNIYNALAAVTAANLLGIGTDIIKKALIGFQNPDKRSQVINSGYIIINDTYNSNPLSAKYALRSMKDIFPNNRKVIIFADMKELGNYSRNYHFDIGKYAYSMNIDVLLTYGDMAVEVMNGAIDSGFNEKNAKHFNSKKELIEYSLKNVTDNDVILVKGSRSMKMEDVADALIR